MKAQHFIIKPGIYPFDIMVSVNESDSVLMDGLKRYGYKTEDIANDILITGTGRTIFLPSNQTLIRLNTSGAKADVSGLIAHEAFHATSYILHHIGIEFDPDKSEEAFTYFLQFIVTEIHSKIKA